MGDLTVPKQRNRPFKPGQSGNAKGKPPGARHAALLALDALGRDAGKDIMQAVVTAAKAGDMRAADILRRLWPERKGRPVTLDLPAIAVPGDIVAALGVITDAVATGELSPDEGAAVVGILETQRRTVETVELERRLVALEQSAVGHHR